MLAFLSKTVPVLCLLLMMQACNIDKTETPVLDTEVEKEYELDLWENLSNQSRTFLIKANTIKNQDCLNYFIESSINRKGNNIEINLGKPQISSVCERGVGTAKSSLDLGTISNGVYPCTIKLGQIVPSTGRLVVSSGSFFLSMPAPIGFRVLHNTLLRIPDNTIWGYIGYDAAAQPVVVQFFNDLAGISQPNDLPKGYYGYFNFLENGSIELDNTQVSTDRPIQPIVRRFSANESDLEKLIQTYRDKYGPSILIRLRNTAGREY
ncbi:MAG: hypothetical protein SFV55_02045 [Haliscomenobacter sp.]|uniref:hypothetical protein n=1 Tax=Haliscomenobacter sp. TaxID=2717303 RepID=UPI0029BB0DC9|nr:hypothetical protein [Haliscomenobacter sp.]MDX2067173.1 hypothetical protein [Haliscomenobacter sp.]